MKRAFFVCLFLSLTTTFLLSQSKHVPLGSTTKADPKAEARILDSYGKLPISFEANRGQTDAKVKFLSRTGGYTLFLTGDEAVLALNGKKADTSKTKIANRVQSLQSANAATKAGGVLRMKLRNANPDAKVTGTDEMAGTSNYFIGNDPTKWRTNVPTYAKVKYEGIYSGIDLVYYGNQRQLEYDFIVAPGADPRRIAFDVRGAKRIRNDGSGELVFKVGGDEIRWHKPVVYQEKDGARQAIAARYAIADENRVEFRLAKYDASRPLYIDPLIYSTYLGGSKEDLGRGIAVDNAGNAYVTGQTASTNFPVTPGAFQTAKTTNCGGCEGINSDAFLTKINPTGSALVYSTYLGGNNYDRGAGIAVDSAGDAFVTGYTTSNNFPITPGAFQTVCGNPNSCANAFVAEINPTGSALVYSTYLGGSGVDSGYGFAVDSVGNAYVTGITSSTDFPTTPGAFQTTYGGGTFDTFVTEINPMGSALVYSTYLGGSGVDYGFGIVSDSAGNAYVSGTTYSTNFPITLGAFQTTINGPLNPFVVKINPTGSALVYSTYLGGSGEDEGVGIAVDSAGDAFVTGYTTSNNFPITPGAFQTVCGNPNSCANAFVTEINPAGSALVYSTYLGGSKYSFASGIAVDNAGDAFVTGYTLSRNFPITPGAFQTTCDCGNNINGDAFVTEINPTGSALVYSTYLGGGGTDAAYGIAVDNVGGIYVAGMTNSTNFPTMNPFQPANGGGYDAFVAKFYTLTLLPPNLNFGNQTVGTTSAPQVSILTNTGTAALTIASISVIGASSGDFAETNNCGASVPAGGSCNISVTFTPTATGTRIAAVSIADNMPSSQQSLPLGGVSLATTATTLLSSINPSLYGKQVTFTAVVSSSAGTPTGRVEYLNGTSVFGTVTLTSGSAKYTTSKLPLGADSITAVYEGDSNNNGSTSLPVNQIVLAETTTTLTSSPNPSTYGEAVTLTAVVTPAPADGETVNFMEGSTQLGTGALSGGSATAAISMLPVGMSRITAVYGGDLNFAASTSKAVKQVVQKAD